MTPFTDDDVKRLKEVCLASHVLSLRTERINDLISRLEAAEKALATPHKSWPHTKESQCSGCVALDEFLAAAGKPPTGGVRE